jgi:hypothetical protein
VYQRIIDLEDSLRLRSLFLFGARQTGKSTLVHDRFGKAAFFDLLEADTFRELSARPEYMRQTVPPGTKNTWSGVSRCSRSRKARWGMRWRCVGRTAMTLAETGSPERIDISPNISPGPRNTRAGAAGPAAPVSTATPPLATK